MERLTRKEQQATEILSRLLLIEDYDKIRPIKRTTKQECYSALIELQKLFSVGNYTYWKPPSEPLKEGE